MPTMTVTLNRQLMKVVRDCVESGLYTNESDVIREAIRQMDDTKRLRDEHKLAALRVALDEGLRQAEAGQTSEYSIEELYRDMAKKKLKK